MKGDGQGKSGNKGQLLWVNQRDVRRVGSGGVGKVVEISSNGDGPGSY